MRKLSLLMALILAACSPQPALVSAHGLPTSDPITATAVAICTPGGVQLAMMLLTYADGTVVRVDAKEMHGFKDLAAIYAYAAKAPDKFGYDLGDCGLQT